MRTRRSASLVLFLLLAPVAAWAQTGITGVVRDTSGAVLPGVTVEAASPALIEKVRSVVSDGQGLYRIVDLRPGPYTVTFTLAGFRTLRRAGIELPAEFTATVNAELAVGALEETVTVSGEAPVVDIRSTRAQVQLTSDTIESIPGSGRLASVSMILPGATLNRPEDRSVGGLNDRAQTTYRIHGGPLAQPVVDGMNLEMPALNQGVHVYNTIALQEVVLETAGAGADRDSGGLQINMISKDGGNTFSGSAQFAFTGPDFEWSNINDALLARHLSNERLGSLKKYRDTAAAFGGPLRRNRLWFFGAFREGVAQLYAEGRYYNKLKQPASLLFEPDLDKPAFTDEFARDITLRHTWQAAAKHKIVLASTFQPNCNCIYNLLQPSPTQVNPPLLAPEATGEHRYNPNYIPTLAWTFPASNRLLLEAGMLVTRTNQNDTSVTDLPYGLPDVPQTDIRITDQGLNLVYGSVPSRTLPRYQYQERFAVSYVTGSHNVKTGVILRSMRQGNIEKLGNDIWMHGTAVQYRFRNGVPNQLTILDAPWNVEEVVRDLALYAQDQWTIRNLTLNGGLRYNDVNGRTPLQVLGAGFFVPERRFEPTKNVPHWRNLSPRLGAAYDLFGDGRTAIKVSLGHYPDRITAVGENPARNLTRTTSRNWTDSNGNYVPDCDLLNPAVNGECGVWSNLNFGKPRTDTTRADDAREGFNRQFYNWQGSVSLQHELRPGIGVNVGYFRTWYGGFLVSDNQLVTPADHDQFCITAPVDSRLPNSGKQLCGLYDIKPEKFGLVNNLVTQASHYGKQTQVYNGVDVTVNARFGEGGLLQGGLSLGRTTTSECFTVDSPQQAREGFCDVTPPWGSSTQVKLLAIYPLPYDIQTSVIYQNVPGIPITASYVVSNSAIAPSLGRNLGSCRGAAICRDNATIELIPATSMFEPRSNEVDLRFSRTFRLAGARQLRGNFDIYNLFNASDVLRMNTRYGAVWQDVQQILSGRLIKIGTQLDF